MAAGPELRPNSLRREGDGLAVDWADGVKTIVAWRTLRKNCPCATCNEERQKPADPFKLLGDREVTAGAPQPAKMAARGQYAYQITWTDGHDTGIYTLELIRYLSESR